MSLKNISPRLFILIFIQIGLTFYMFLNGLTILIGGDSSHLQFLNYYNQEKIDMTTYSLYRKALSLFPRLDLYQKQEVISAMNDLKAKIKAQEEDSEQNEDDNDFY